MKVGLNSMNNIENYSKVSRIIEESLRLKMLEADNENKICERDRRRLNMPFHFLGGDYMTGKDYKNVLDLAKDLYGVKDEEVKSIVYDSANVYYVYTINDNIPYIITNYSKGDV